jgi:hypothetical protein
MRSVRGRGRCDGRVLVKVEGRRGGRIGSGQREGQGRVRRAGGERLTCLILSKVSHSAHPLSWQISTTVGKRSV